MQPCVGRLSSRMALCAALVGLLVVPAACQQGPETGATKLRSIPLDDLPQLRSDAPLFAKIVARPGYDAAMWVILDESGGTGSGHDILYCDFNYDGVLGGGERTRVQSPRQHTAYRSFYVYPPFSVPPPAGEESTLTKPLLRLACLGRQDGPPVLPLSATLSITEDGQRWQYRLSKSLETGPRPEEAPLTRLDGTPRMRVTVRQGAQGAIRLGVDTHLGKASLTDYKCNGVTGEVQIIVRDTRDVIRYQTAGSLDKFCFG